VVADAGLAVAGLLELVAAKPDRGDLESSTEKYTSWRERQEQLADPDHDARGVVEKVRSAFDNPDKRIRPEAVAVAVDKIAAEDAIFTTDTGLSTVWLTRFVTLSGTRRLVGSYNLGSMANAMPQGLGAQALDRKREVVALRGDGGLTMLLGDLTTAVQHELPVRLIVFTAGRPGHRSGRT
jgi:pyruvate dehydrogenase (quinone)